MDTAGFQDLTGEDVDLAHRVFFDSVDGFLSESRAQKEGSAALTPIGSVISVALRPVTARYSGFPVT
jgi:hypothetical protein